MTGESAFGGCSIIFDVEVSINFNSSTTLSLLLFSLLSRNSFIISSSSKVTGLPHTSIYAFSRARFSSRCSRVAGRLGIKYFKSEEIELINE
ncbi:unnamed protein product [Meloidogyne enterolobii]|uniref:Uncharacterized protein n=1 Tax=Meloidogyne enterolobii TaxID=390850 RepID=A0ACB0ZEK9_MELEN